MDFSVWIEAEALADGGQSAGEEGSDVVVEFADGRRWQSSFITPERLASIVAPVRGECGTAAHALVHRSVVVAAIERATIERAVGDLLATGEFANAFSRCQPESAPVACLIFNPRSGQGSAGADLRKIRSLLEPHFALRICHTRAGADPADLAREALSSQADVVIAAGGDGTVSAVAGQVAGSRCALGIIPRGTANAFAAALGLADLFDPVGSACETIIAGQRRAVDLAVCNGRPMILLAGIGFEAETIELASRQVKDQWGPLAYFIAGWEQMQRQKMFQATLTIDGQTRQFSAQAITVANAAPATSVLAQGKGEVLVDDGLLDVTVASAESKLDAIVAMLDMFGAALLNMAPSVSERVVHVRAREVTIAADPPQKVVVDGEPFGQTPVTISCLPGRLSVLAPLACALVVLFLAFSLPAPCRAEAEDKPPYELVVDGAMFSDLKVPTYEWKPSNAEPEGMALAIHGLTLHGRRYEIMGRAFAAGGYYFAAPDMRGFGRLRQGESHDFCPPGCRGKDDCRRRVDYEKSYADAVEMARRMKARYPKLRLIAVGESLGATPCLRLAGEHPELVDGVIISGPAIRLQPLMFFEPGHILAGLKAIFLSVRGDVRLETFLKKLVSDDPDIVRDLSEDPLVAKELTIGELLATHSFVSKSISYARKISRDMPILILQGSLDRCVIPKAVVELSKNIGSSDQNLRWLHNHSHLLLETSYVRAATVGAITHWFDDHDDARLAEVREVEAQIQKLGGKIRQ